jgi:CHAT domain-containing protein
MTLRSPLAGRACLALSVLLFAGCRDGQPRHLALRPGLSVPSEVKSGAAQRFTFDLRRDQYLELRATQDPVDVVLTASFPGGKRRAPLDTQTPDPIPEVLRLVATRGGRYLLEVTAGREGAKGVSRLEVVGLRPATARDRQVVQADERLAEAEALRRKADEASRRRALPLYAQAADLFVQAGDQGGEGYARTQWARVLVSQLQKEEALACLRRELALPPGTQPPGLRARALTLLSSALEGLGRGADADVAGRQALELWRKSGHLEQQAGILNDLARRASGRGELAQAEAWYREALAAWEHSGDGDSAALVLGNLASVYTLAGEPHLAFDTAEEGLARLPAGAVPGDRAFLLEQKGEALHALGHDQEAQSALEQAMALRRGGDALPMAKLERRLGRHLYEQWRFAEAASRLRSALATLERAQESESALAARQDLAWAELKRGHLDEAELLFTQVAAEGKTAGSRWVEAAALAGQARLEWARGRFEPALATARRALGAVENLRREVGRADLTSAVFASHQVFFDVAEDMVLQRFDQTQDHALLVEAFEIAERSRARRLLDLLATQPAAGSHTPNDKERQAGEAVNLAEERLGALRAADAPAVQSEEAERAVRRAVLSLRRAAEPSPAPSFGGTPLSLPQIQRWLPRDAALVEVDLGEDASYLWVLSGRSLTVHRLPPEREVEAQARQALDVLSAPGINSESVQGKVTLQRTARLLLGQAMPELGARRWLLVMDGVLHALPIGALPNPERPEEPILESREVAFAPSASVAVLLSARDRRQRADPRKELAVFAGAIYQRSDSQPSNPSAGLQVAQSAGANRQRSTLGASRLDLPQLRYSEEEAQHLLGLVPPASCLDARGLGSTKARILAGELEAYRLLHFAVHGLPNEEHPELSGLALSLFDRQGRPQDGLLHAYEIARLRLSPDLVVLSACQSGRGAIVSGEGLVGLAHAFFTAGAARVVVSDWAVDDHATSVLMSLFYEGLLRRHLSPARALQRAQLTLARQEPWRRPYYWGAFVVQGGF